MLKKNIFKGKKAGLWKKKKIGSQPHKICGSLLSPFFPLNSSVFRLKKQFHILLPNLLECTHAAQQTFLSFFLPPFTGSGIMLFSGQFKSARVRRGLIDKGDQWQKTWLLKKVSYFSYLPQTREKARDPGREPGSQLPDQILAIYHDFAAKSLSGQAIYIDFVTKIFSMGLTVAIGLSRNRIETGI